MWTTVANKQSNIVIIMTVICLTEDENKMPETLTVSSDWLKVHVLVVARQRLWILRCVANGRC